MMRIAICDDDAIFLEKAGHILNDYISRQKLESQIYLFHNEKELEKYIESGGEPLDLLFLDIELGEASGIEVAEEINRRMPKCGIAFLTNYLAYATDVYDVSHCYYIVKPELEERIPYVFRAFHLGQGEKKISVSWRGETFIFHIADIRYVERGRRCSFLIMDDKTVKVRDSFEQVCMQLAGSYFVRCHNSYMVNFNEIQKLRANDLTLADGTVITISRKYKEHVKKSFSQWREVWL